MVCHLLRTPTYSTGTLWTVARSPWKLSSSYLHFCSSTQITCTSTEATMRITSWTWGSIVTSLPSSCSYSQLCAVLNNHKKYLKDLLLLLFQIWLYKRSNAEVQGNIIFATRWLLLEFHTCRYFHLDFLQTHGREILQLLQDVFSLLPIATIIDNKVLIVHGGISDETDLDFLSTVERHKVSLSPPVWVFYPPDLTPDSPPQLRGKSGVFKKTSMGRKKT